MTGGIKTIPGTELSFRPARLHGLADRYDNPMQELTLSPSQGSMNSANRQRFANDSIYSLGEVSAIQYIYQEGRTRKAYAKNTGYIWTLFYLYWLENASFLQIFLVFMITCGPAIFQSRFFTVNMLLKLLEVTYNNQTIVILKLMY